MPSLSVQLPGLPPVSHVLKDETITVGRMKGNTIVIEDDSVSLMHARISQKNGQAFLKDLNSTNGTTINGQPIKEAKLRHFDRIGFADIEAQFLADSPAANAPVVAERLDPVSKPMAGNPTAVGTNTSTRPALAINSSHFMSYAAAVAGTIAVLAVLGTLGWRFFHLDQNAHVRASNLVAVPAHRANIPVRTQPSAVVPVPAANAAVANLLKALQDPDPAERRRAASGLHALGADAKEAVPSLRDALKDSDEEVQMWAALSLINNHVYDKATLPILIKALGHDSSILRRVACLSLGLIPYESAEKDIVVPTLAEAAGRDPDEQVREAARSALHIIAPEIVGQARPTP